MNSKMLVSTTLLCLLALAIGASNEADQCTVDSSGHNQCKDKSSLLQSKVTVNEPKAVEAPAPDELEAATSDGSDPDKGGSGDGTDSVHNPTHEKVYTENEHTRETDKECKDFKEMSACGAAGCAWEEGACVEDASDQTANSLLAKVDGDATNQVDSERWCSRRRAHRRRRSLVNTGECAKACVTLGSCHKRWKQWRPMNMAGQGRTKESSINACQQRCGRVSGCAHFTYWRDGGCHIQDSKAQARAGCCGVKAGPASCESSTKNAKATETTKALQALGNNNGGCHVYKTVEGCVSSKDGRRGHSFSDSPCQWCCGDACTTNNANKCEPKQWLFQQGNYVGKSKNGLGEDSCKVAAPTTPAPTPAPTPALPAATPAPPPAATPAPAAVPVPTPNSGDTKTSLPVAGSVGNLFDRIDTDDDKAISRKELDEAMTMTNALNALRKKFDTGAISKPALPAPSPATSPVQPAPAPPPPTGSSVLTQAQKDAIVQKHNTLRTSRGASDMTKMAWDDTLATAAQQWVSGCPGGHSRNRPNDVGENIASRWATNLKLTDTTDFSSSVQSWYDEVADSGPYKTGGTFIGFGQCPGVCGHYTQVVWAAANEIGCGAAYCPDIRTKTGMGGSGMGGYKLVCQYGSSVSTSSTGIGYGGNMRSSTLFTKGTACSKCPSGFNKCSDNLCSFGA